MATEEKAEYPLLSIRDVTKKFPALVANRSVSLNVQKGEIVALLGENGAGKSTLMKIVFGLYQSDEGDIAISGEPHKPRSPADAIRAGIGMVHQELMLIPALTVAENVILGSRMGRIPVLKLDRVAQAVAKIAGKYGFDVDPWEKVERLSLGERQRVEIIKALYRGAKLLILDEPTSVLSSQEIPSLFRMLRQFASEGSGVIFISHKLREVLEISDRVVVLRDGEVVATRSAESTGYRELARFMVGRDIESAVVWVPGSGKGETVLRTHDMTVVDAEGRHRLRKISLDVRAGEIVTIAGIDGNGQGELADAISGMGRISDGSISICGTDVTEKSVRERMQLGLRYVPEDRTGTALVLDFPVDVNVALRQFYRPPFAKSGMLDRTSVTRIAEDVVKRYKVRVANVANRVGFLSGGNQQRLVLGRETWEKESLLLVFQGTSGLDVGAAEALLVHLLELRNQGVGILYISTDLEEALGICDRVGVLHAGELVGMFDRGEVTRETVGLLMAGGKARSEGDPAPTRGPTG